MTSPSNSHVTQTQPAHSEIARQHYAAKLSLETDCWDVHESMKAGNQDFVLIDVRGAKAFSRRHVPGAICLTRDAMTAEKMAEWPADILFVVYCAGPHCNGADKAALVLAQLGKKVKIMIGGITGWEDEGFEFTTP